MPNIYDNNTGRWPAASAIAGGVLWTALRPLISDSWGRPILGLTYEDYNRIMALPLLLLLAGVWGIAIRYWYDLGKAGRLGVVLVALGLVGALAGVVVEFWWAGGLSGNREGAVWGWSIYLLGLLVHLIGLVLFGIATLTKGVLSSWSRPIPLVMAALLVFWLPSLIVGLEDWGNAGKALIGIGWVMLGVALLSSKAPAMHEITSVQRLPVNKEESSSKAAR